MASQKSVPFSLAIFSQSLLSLSKPIGIKLTISLQYLISLSIVPYSSIMRGLKLIFLSLISLPNIIEYCILSLEITQSFIQCRHFYIIFYISFHLKYSITFCLFSNNQNFYSHPKNKIRRHKCPLYNTY